MPIDNGVRIMNQIGGAARASSDPSQAYDQGIPIQPGQNSSQMDPIAGLPDASMAPPPPSVDPTLGMTKATLLPAAPGDPPAEEKNPYKEDSAQFSPAMFMRGGQNTMAAQGVAGTAQQPLGKFTGGR